jgi:hypothetical protein
MWRWKDGWMMGTRWRKKKRLGEWEKVHVGLAQESRCLVEERTSFDVQ